jgi:hypothetical protein
MRASRKRFVRPKPPRTTRRTSIDGSSSTTRFMHNIHGRAAQREALAEQRRQQNSLCAKCGNFLPWAEARFEFRECPDGTINRAIHKGKCT